MTITAFSWARFVAVLAKEFVQMRRDRLTFAMMVGIPIMQLILFGFAINSDPKNLPTAVLVADPSPFARSLQHALENSGYFRVTHVVSRPADGDELIQNGTVQFLVTVPEDFSRKLQRGDRPAVLVEVDASDPAATSNALTAILNLNQTALDHDLVGPLSQLKAASPPFELRVQRRYNPEGISQYNIVPGLIGVVLTMTMVLMTSLSMTRERERGTMENLLATPVRPIEVMAGKIIPFIIVGSVQITLILTAAKLLFQVPMMGSLALLSAASVLFIAANLSVGFTFSTIAANQLQAMQMGFFFFLPSIMLSGFMFPFRGMPQWAQWLGEVLPLTHFLRIVRGILLKGNEVAEIAPDLWPIALFVLGAAAIALSRYRETVD
jgi:ABC-2 type transport system permease protein